MISTVVIIYYHVYSLAYVVVVPGFGVHIVFSLRNIVGKTLYIKIPEVVNVSPLGNFSYLRFTKSTPIITMKIYHYYFLAWNMYTTAFFYRY